MIKERVWSVMLLVTTVELALKIVRNLDVSILSLDYNMGWRQKNGLDFLEVFCRKGLRVLHTNDSIGMQYTLEQIKKGKEAGDISTHIQVKCMGNEKSSNDFIGTFFLMFYMCL